MSRLCRRYIRPGVIPDRSRSAIATGRSRQDCHCGALDLDRMNCPCLLPSKWAHTKRTAPAQAQRRSRFRCFLAAYGTGRRISLLPKGQRSFRVSPECEHSSASLAALKARVQSSWQETRLTCSCVLIRGEPRRLKDQCVPLSVARRRGDARISCECHCILIRSIK